MANWAIVIGVDQYWTPKACLKGAVRDALKMYTWLTDVNGGAVPARNVTLLLSPAASSPSPPAGVTAQPATQEMVVEAIERLLQKSGERFFFYYAGHGLTTRMGFSNESGLIPSDFTDRLTTRALTLRSIFEVFQATQFHEQYFFIDACRNIPWVNEFRIGEYPQPRKPTPPTPPQFIMYATSPGVRAVELRQAGDERGAFTEALLHGLQGQGAAKVWDDEAEEYVVRWESLFTFVETAVKQQRLPADAQRVPPLIQEPRQFGERGSLNPELGRFSLGAFPDETLEVNLDPATAAPQAEVVVSDLGGVRQREKPVAQLPVRFTLEPGTYSVRAAAPNLRVERVKGYYPVDLYGPTTVMVKLVPGTAPAHVVLPPTALTRGLEGSEPASLTVRSNDPLAYLEMADNTGKIIQTGQGELTDQNLPPGFYRARLRTPEGVAVEQLFELAPGESESATLEARPLPTSGVFHQVITDGGFFVEEDNALWPSEAVGPVAGCELSTLLALAGGAVNEATGYGQKLRRIGLPPFRETVGAQANSGVQILFGIETEQVGIETEQAPALLSQVRLRCWAQSETMPPGDEQPLPFSTTAGLAQFAWDKPPGSYWLAIELPGQEPLVLAVSVLPNRLTLLVAHQNVAGQANLYQYLPSLTPDAASDPQFPGARFPLLRRLEFIERSYLSGRFDQAYQNAAQLLQAPAIDPLAGCLGGYLQLASGRMRELMDLASYMVNQFGELSDSHVLAAEFAASRGQEAQAVQAYQTALDRGLPIVQDGLVRLANAVQQYQLQHPQASVVQNVFSQRLRDALWSATAAPDLSAGQTIQATA